MLLFSVSFSLLSINYCPLVSYIQESVLFRDLNSAALGLKKVAFLK